MPNNGIVPTGAEERRFKAVTTGEWAPYVLDTVTGKRALFLTDEGARKGARFLEAGEMDMDSLGLLSEKMSA